MKKLTKRQIACIIICGVALLALVCDRLLLSDQTGPQSAAAAPRQTASARRGVPRPQATAAPAPSKRTPIRRRLADLAERMTFDSDTDGDAMRPSDAWLAELTPADDVKVAPPPVVGESPTAAFRRSHRLEAVMLRDRGGQAVVNGRMLSVGETLDGFRLTGLSTTSATFESGEKTVVLTLKLLPTGMRDR